MRIKTIIVAAAFMTVVNTNAHGSTFGVLAQFQAGFTGLTSYQLTVHGLNGFLSGILNSYAQSGRPYGFYTQAFNNQAFSSASSFNSSGLFQRFF